MKFNNKAIAGLFTVAFLLALVPASAVAVPCVNTADDRYMTLTPSGGGTVTCEAGGSTPDDPEGTVHSDLGFTQIEKIEDDGGSSSVTGTYFSITGLGTSDGGVFSITDDDFYSLFSNVKVVFKFGANLDPDWFRYGLVDVFSADWTVEPTQGGGLSHVTLYGDESEVPVPPGGNGSVPVPGTLALLGVGMLLMRRSIFSIAN